MCPAEQPIQIEQTNCYSPTASHELSSAITADVLHAVWDVLHACEALPWCATGFASVFKQHIGDQANNVIMRRATICTARLLMGCRRQFHRGRLDLTNRLINLADIRCAGLEILDEGRSNDRPVCFPLQAQHLIAATNPESHCQR